MSVSDNHSCSDDEVDPFAHQKLLDAVSNLGRTQHIRKATRFEPSVTQDEFHLVKTTKSGDASEHGGVINSVSVNDLVQVLKKTNKHINVGKELKNVRAAKKVIPRPLEKPVAERIRRTIGYEKAIKQLTRWDAVVAKNRTAELQIFPLQSETVYINTEVSKIPPPLSIKSDLMMEIEAAEKKLRLLKNPEGEQESENEANDEKELQRKLTRDELLARRKELAFLKLRESQKSAKARMQNKIKSKKFHKLMKRQKIKDQMKEFEILRKTNPEAALEKLNMIEKNRVLERANLRHKNTGSWAKNLQVRAKYDKDVRKDLAEQLSISRHLTQKQEDSDDKVSDDDNEDKVQTSDNKNSSDPFNPWERVNSVPEESTPGTESGSLGYRKYWATRNEISKISELYMKEIRDEEEHQNINTESKNIEKSIEKKIKLEGKPSAKKNCRKTGKHELVNGWVVEEIDAEATPSVMNIDDIFDSAEDKISSKISKKLKLISQKERGFSVVKKNKPPKKSTATENNMKSLADLSFKKTALRPEFDEKLIETDYHGQPANSEEVSLVSSKHASILNPKVENIDANKFSEVKPKFLTNAAPGLLSCEDYLDEADYESRQFDKQMTINEAFEDDDIVNDFTKEKGSNLKEADEQLDLSMPGWGSWAGSGISNDATKTKKRMILKFPKAEVRRDDNKGTVYINEDVNKKIKEHLVTDLPFPFTSVQDYEASIRAPIGRSFVPELPFRLLTRPAVVTRKGMIIEPMDESELVRPPIRSNNEVDKRIERLTKSSKCSK